jgi:thiosulfate reductase cytochrome b subunit
MSSSIPVLLLVALLAANLPFVSQRIGGMIAVRHKRFAWRLLEFLLLYLLVGVFAHQLEAREMPVQPQGWTFYVCTFALFVVFSFPGFVLYSFRRRT